MPTATGPDSSKSLPQQQVQQPTPKYYGKIVVIKRNGQDSASFELSDPNYLFGRAERCDIRIQLASIGEEHCRIFPEPRHGRHAMLQNLSSVGVSINKVPIQDHKEHPLKAGDIITIVERCFRYENPFWTEPETMAVDVMEEDVQSIESPFLKSSTPTKTPSAVMKMVSKSPAKTASTPTKSESPRKSMTPRKEGTPLSTATPKLGLHGNPETPSKSYGGGGGATISTPSKTPGTVQSQVSPAKQSNTPTGFTVTMSPGRVKVESSLQSPRNDEFAVEQTMDSYNPPRSPAKFTVMEQQPKTPVKASNSQPPTSVTPASQTRDIGQILPPGSISRTPIGAEPTAAGERLVTTPQEKQMSPIGSAGFHALMSSASHVDQEQGDDNVAQPHESPIAAQSYISSPRHQQMVVVVDAEISASPRLSPRIRLLVQHSESPVGGVACIDHAMGIVASPLKQHAQEPDLLAEATAMTADQMAVLPDVEPVELATVIEESLLCTVSEQQPATTTADLDSPVWESHKVVIEEESIEAIVVERPDNPAEEPEGGSQADAPATPRRSARIQQQRSAEPTPTKPSGMTMETEGATGEEVPAETETTPATSNRRHSARTPRTAAGRSTGSTSSSSGGVGDVQARHEPVEQEADSGPSVRTSTRRRSAASTAAAAAVTKSTGARNQVKRHQQQVVGQEEITDNSPSIAATRRSKRHHHDTTDEDKENDVGVDDDNVHGVDDDDDERSNAQQHPPTKTARKRVSVVASEPDPPAAVRKSTRVIRTATRTK